MEQREPRKNPFTSEPLELWARVVLKHGFCDATTAGDVLKAADLWPWDLLLCVCSWDRSVPRQVQLHGRIEDARKQEERAQDPDSSRGEGALYV